MKLAHASALYAAPVPLRIVLALTFIWAGLGKFIHQVPIQGEQAALLANMGYDFSNAKPATPDEETDQDLKEPAETESSDESTSIEHRFPDQPIPPTVISTRDIYAPRGPEPSMSINGQRPALPALLQIDTSNAADSNDPNSEPDPDLQQTAPAAPTFTAADFPEPVEVRSLYMVSILTYNAAHPTPDAEGNTPPPIWPDWAARDAWPRYTAWAAAATELAAGVLIAIGLLTRLSAITLATVMLSAAWLTELGPAIQAGDTLLGFLPNHDIWDIYAWRPLLWQCSLFGAALALALTGPGAIAIDHVPVDRDDDDDDDDDNE